MAVDKESRKEDNRNPVIEKGLIVIFERFFSVEYPKHVGARSPRPYAGIRRRFLPIAPVEIVLIEIVEVVVVAE